MLLKVVPVHGAHSYFVLISTWWQGGRGVDMGLLQSTEAPKHHQSTFGALY